MHNTNLRIRKMNRMKKSIVFCWLVMASIIYVDAQDDSIAVDSQMIEAAPRSFTKMEMNTAFAKSQADSAYIHGDYVSAIAIYEAILADRKESSEIYYNLGNSYYKNNNIAKAVLNLERALLLDPGDDDIRFNLEMVKSKTIDRVPPVNEFLFVTWFKSIKSCMGIDDWAKMAIVSFLVFIFALVMYIFGKKLVLRKIGLIVVTVSFISVILSNIFAYSQKNQLINRNNAIIMVPSVTVKSTPSEKGMDLFVLHEGHKVHIRDSSMKEWIEIKLEDGNIGWIPTSVVEII